MKNHWKYWFWVTLITLAGVLIVCFFRTDDLIFKTVPQQISKATEINHFHLSKLALNTGEYSTAIHLLEKQSIIYPNNAELLWLLTQAYYQKEHPLKALKILEKLVNLPNIQNQLFYSDALLLLAKLYSRNAFLEKSRNTYQIALLTEIRPKKISIIHNQLAELDLTEGHYQDDGNTIYNAKGLVIGGVGPGDMRTNQAFEIARHTSDPNKKLKYFKQSIKTDPGMHQAYFNVGLGLVNQQKYAIAIPFFKQADSVWQRRKDINPLQKQKASALAYWGYCEVEKGQINTGLKLINTALQLDESYYYAAYFKAIALYRLKSDIKSLLILKDLLKDNPDAEEVLELIQKIQKKQKPSN